ncbi:MAG: alpha-mannosidase, partial [Bacillota bacterium]
MFFTEEKIDKYLNDLQDFIYRNTVEIKEFRHYRGNPAGAEAPGFDDSGWDLFQVGSVWGGADVTAWFRTSIEIPGDWRQSRVALYLDLGRGHHGGLAGAESLLFINGQPVKGLDVNHKEVMLKSEWLQQDKLEIAIRAFSGLEQANMFKQSTLVNDAGQDRKQFKTARLVKIDEQTEDFYYRALTALETIGVLEEDSLDRQQRLNFLNQAINIIDFRRPGSPEFYESIARANQGLKDDLARYKPEFDNKPLVTAVGHSHIDVAWLWRLCHTREKCSRTFSSVLKLMEQYPEYQFLQSMPQLYEYIKEDYPEIYEQIKEKVKQGDWEVTGGMWVEADCNLSSGESLVRQFLFGTRFMKEEFDVDCNLLWLPDVFGYSWALPQIIKKSGLRYFMTTKISWSQFNRPEYDTFSWRGIDGTEVLTHFITTPVVNEERPFYTYNGILDPESVQGIWDNYRQKDINDQLLLAFGWGDGGGGPTKKMIETGRRMQEMPGLPEVEFGKAEPYYRRLEERVADNPQLPVWDGELYLEYHRGTYTSQAEVKKNNRKSEILYQNLEKLGSLARLMMGNYQYPQGDINQGWKTILRNQFHDIIPGSSIREVYEDSEEEFAQIKETGTDLIQETLTDLAGEIELEGEKLLVFNPLSWAREGIVTLP